MSLAAYEAAHSIELVLSAPLAVASGRIYTITLSGETGANAIANALALSKLTITYTPPQ